MSTGHNLIQMSTSLISNIQNDSNLMIQSLDPNLLSSATKSHSNIGHDVSSRSSSQASVVASMNQSNGRVFSSNCLCTVLICNEFLERQGNPLAAASKMVPVPESLMSPDCPPSNTVHRTALTSNTSVHSSGYNNLPNNKFAKSKGKSNEETLTEILLLNVFLIPISSKLSEESTNHINKA